MNPFSFSSFCSTTPSHSLVSPMNQIGIGERLRCRWRWRWKWTLIQPTRHILLLEPTLHPPFPRTMHTSTPPPPPLRMSLPPIPLHNGGKTPYAISLPRITAIASTLPMPIPRITREDTRAREHTRSIRTLHQDIRMSFLCLLPIPNNSESAIFLQSPGHGASRAPHIHRRDGASVFPRAATDRRFPPFTRGGVHEIPRVQRRETEQHC
jgi:hypothetical protein